MNNPEWLETFIEEEGFNPIAEDQYECAGGHVWHIDEIKDLAALIDSIWLDGIRPTKKLFDFWHGTCRPPRAKVQGRVINNALWIT